MSSTLLRTWGVGLVLLLPAAGSADEVLLRGGGKITGIVVERTERMVVLETGPGRVSVPLSRVERIEDGESSLQAFRERAATIDPGDAVAWARLARWAEEHDLATAAREAWQHVLTLDPNHPEANAAVGRYLVEGQWMEEAEARRRLGFVQWQGRWVTPAEHRALVRERVADQEDAREQREAELRVREAEARAREAEARARQAETEAEQTTEGTGGIPYDWVIYGSSAGPVIWPGGRPPHGPHPTPHDRPPDARPPQGGQGGPPPSDSGGSRPPSSIGSPGAPSHTTAAGIQAPSASPGHQH